MERWDGRLCCEVGYEERSVVAHGARDGLSHCIPATTHNPVILCMPFSATIQEVSRRKTPSYSPSLLIVITLKELFKLLIAARIFRR